MMLMGGSMAGKKITGKLGEYEIV
eukprot:SAG31_NODE_13693_length_852_cov_8.386454_1_plen_23_part_01